MIRLRSIVLFKRCVMNVLINEKQSSICFHILCLVFADFYHNLIFSIFAWLYRAEAVF